MKQLFVIGDPVAHSLSPLLHQAMIDQTGAAYRYDVRTVRPEELPAFVRWAKDGGCAGFNVTMPHKEAILPLLDEVDTTAASCGAVNTVCIRERRAIGHNTDGTGFLDSLAGQGFYPQGRTVLLLGAGGAATRWRQPVQVGSSCALAAWSAPRRWRHSSPAAGRASCWRRTPYSRRRPRVTCW